MLSRYKEDSIDETVNNHSMAPTGHIFSISAPRNNEAYIAIRFIGIEGRLKLESSSFRPTA